MELLAAIDALEKLRRPGLQVTIYTDSRYVADAVEKGWLFAWEKKGFAKKKNPDLWKRFLVQFRQHNIRFVWVKGHANNLWNERCDQLAVAASYQPNLPPDQGYLDSLKTESIFD